MSKILLVEDDPLAREIATSILQCQNIEVDVACDGFAALRLLRDTHYRAAIVDYHLPEMDGFALARLMRDITASRPDSIFMVGVTADRHGLAARRGADGLFDAILAKPFDPHELLRLMADKPTPPTRIATGAAAAALLSDPDFHRARGAAETFWRARGLSQCPRVAVLPRPTTDEIAAIRMCFDVVDAAQADFTLLLDARGLQDLVRLRMASEHPLPVVAMDKAFAATSDACFVVSDPASWSAVAALVKRRAAQ